MGGMFGEHFLLAKLLETLIEPAYYPPVKYMHEIYDRGMTLYGEPKAQIWKQLMSTSDQPMVAELGQKMILPKAWPTFFNHSRKEVMKEGRFALLQSILEPQDLELNWWRSTDVMPGKPAFTGGGYLSNKKWPLQQTMNHHLIILQQAGLVRNPVPFDLEKNRPRKKGADEYGMVKLRPEHIYLPLMIHGGGVGCGLGMLILEWIWKKTGLGED